MTAVPAVGRRDALTQAGQNRLDAVMETARALLVSEGYANLKMRRVAAEAGISIGHLQHFLPTRESLFEALWVYASHQYDEDYEKIRKNLPADPTKRLIAIADYLVRDTMVGPTKTFFIELWSMARHYPGARSMMDRMHQHHRQVIADMIGEIKPELTDAERDIRSLQIAGLIDGLMVHLDESLAEPGCYAPVREIVDTILAIATAPTVASDVI